MKHFQWLPFLLLGLLPLGCSSAPGPAASGTPAVVASASPAATPGGGLEDGPGPAPVVDKDKADDSLVTELEKDEAERFAPAMAWLADSNHSLWKGDRAELVAHFKALEKAGVKEIRANYNDVDGHQVCAMFIVTLPKDKRPPIFGLYNEFWKKQAGDDQEALAEVSRTDKGQKYLVYNLDQ